LFTADGVPKCGSIILSFFPFIHSSQFFLRLAFSLPFVSLYSFFYYLG
jgi:hypothetical protein